jgi:hypothetical protein
MIRECISTSHITPPRRDAPHSARLPCSGGCGLTRPRSDALDEFRERLAYIRGAVQVSLDNVDQRAKFSNKPDDWLPASPAQYALLTEENSVYVGNAYEKAKIAGKDSFSVDSEAQQVGIFASLGMLAENCAASLKALGVPPAPPAPLINPAPPASALDCVIVGTPRRTACVK